LSIAAPTCALRSATTNLWTKSGWPVARTGYGPSSAWTFLPGGVRSTMPGASPTCAAARPRPTTPPEASTPELPEVLRPPHSEQFAIPEIRPEHLGNSDLAVAGLEVLQHGRQEPRRRHSRVVQG